MLGLYQTVGNVFPRQHVRQGKHPESIEAGLAEGRKGNYQYRYQYRCLQYEGAEIDAPKVLPQLVLVAFKRVTGCPRPRRPTVAYVVCVRYNACALCFRGDLHTVLEYVGPYEYGYDRTCLLGACC
jgi:hypothetical protein